MGRVLFLAAAIVLSGSAVPAAEQPAPAPQETAEPAGAGQGHAAQAGTSPWEQEIWRDSTLPMRMFICRREAPLASWCAESAATRFIEPAPAPEPLAPPRPKAVSDQVWAKLVTAATAGGLTREQVGLVRRRAVEDGDPQAIELMGYIHAMGVGVPENRAEAYRWYARAYLTGSSQVRANMDRLWSTLTFAEQKQLVAEFDNAVRKDF